MTMSSGLLSDQGAQALAVKEMQQLGLADEVELLDATVLRVPKAYPGYFGAAFERFGELREWLDGLNNLLCVRPQWHAPLQQPGSLDARRGRAGHHGAANRESIWSVNIDDEYPRGTGHQDVGASALGS